MIILLVEDYSMYHMSRIVIWLMEHFWKVLHRNLLIRRQIQIWKFVNHYEIL